MKKILIFLMAVMFLNSCTSKALLNGAIGEILPEKEPPLEYSFMPEYLDLDSVGENVEPDTSGEHFKQYPLMEGDTVKNDGVLISERMVKKYVFYKSDHERISKELDMSEFLRKEYYDKAKDAEKLYQERIVDLEKTARRSWWEKNRIYFGFIAGLATAILTEFAVVNVAK